MADVKTPTDISSSPRRSVDAAPEKTLDADEIRLAQMGEFLYHHHPSHTY